MQVEQLSDSSGYLQELPNRRRNGAGRHGLPVEEHAKQKLEGGVTFHQEGALQGLRTAEMMGGNYW